MKIRTLLFGLFLSLTATAQGRLNAYDYAYKQKDIVDYVVQKNGQYGLFHNHKELLAPAYDSIGVLKGPTPIVIKDDGRYSVFVVGSDLKLYSTGETFEEFHAGSTFSVGIDKGVRYYLYSGKDLRAKKVQGRTALEETFTLNTQQRVVLLNVDNNKQQVIEADTVNEEIVISYPYFLLATNHAQRFTVLDINSLECCLSANENNRSVELVKLFKNGDSSSSYVKVFLKVRDLHSISIYHLAFESIRHSEKGADGVWIVTYDNAFQYLTSEPVNPNDELVLSFYSEKPSYVQIDKTDVTTNAVANVGYVSGLTSDDPLFITFEPYIGRVYTSGRSWGLGLFWWGGK